MCLTLHKLAIKNIKRYLIKSLRPDNKETYRKRKTFSKRLRETLKKE